MNAVPRISTARRRCERRISLRSGFTLIEVMLVLVILSVIMGLVVVNASSVLGRNKESAAKTQVQMLGNHVNTYLLTVGSLPSSLSDLYEQPSNIPDPTKWSRIIQEPVQPDPWNNPYELKVSGNDFEIRSYGPDGQANTQDDITNKPA